MGLLSRRRRCGAKGYQNLTFRILTAGTVAWNCYDGSNNVLQGGTAIEYRKNGGSWSTMACGSTLQVAQGDRLQFRGSSTAYAQMTDNSWTAYHGFGGTATFNASGHICSLTGGGNTLTAINTFYRLFTHASVVSAHNLLLADNVTNHCYNSLFNGCTSLTVAPVLPATTLAPYCYGHMFNGCTSLTTAPALPAKTLATYCYRQMFGGCTSLTTAPTLPATTLVDHCYRYMFTGCTSLTASPALPATTLKQYCYYYMFYGCSALTTAGTISGTTLATYCCACMFRNCTSLVNVQTKLPATTLATYCYYYMFNGCTSLTTAPELPARTLSSNCYGYMFNGCSKLNYIKALFTTNPSTSYTQRWVEGVAASGTFKKYTSATWNVTGVNGVPSGWTVSKVSS